MGYVDHSPLNIHLNDTHLIRDVEVKRVALIAPDGHTKAYFKNSSEAAFWKNGRDSIVDATMHRYCLVDPATGNRRSWWFETLEDLEKYILKYPPQGRPDLGRDEYNNA